MIKEIPKNKKNNYDLENEKILVNNLNEKYFKIKECLSRCENNVEEISGKEETIELLQKIYNSK